MASKSVSVHIVTWNSAAVLPTFFHSLRKQTLSPSQCVVIDNASTDSSVDCVRDLAPQATVIRNDTNRGFSVAHNQGMKLSSCEYVLVVNPDIVLARNTVEKLVFFTHMHPLAGSCGGKMLRRGANPPVFDGAGIVVTRARRCSNRGEGDVDTGQYETEEQVFGISGACALYRRAALESIKISHEYFDEDFFAYKEDIDLAWRLRLAGWQNWYIPSAVVWHQRSVRSSQYAFAQEQRKGRTFQNLLSYRNHLLLLLKNDRFLDWVFPLPRVLLYEFMKFVYLLFHERSTLKGIFDSIHLAPAMLRKRAIAMRRAKVSPKSIERFFSQ